MAGGLGVRLCGPRSYHGEPADEPWLNGGARDWPPSIQVADGVDTGMLTRRLRMAAAWAGRCRVGAFKAGDGTASIAAELPGEHATITLALVIDPETRILRLADVAP